MQFSKLLLTAAAVMVSVSAAPTGSNQVNQCKAKGYNYAYCCNKSLVALTCTTLVGGSCSPDTTTYCCNQQQSGNTISLSTCGPLVSV